MNDGDDNDDDDDDDDDLSRGAYWGGLISGSLRYIGYYVWQFSLPNARRCLFMGNK